MATCPECAMRIPKLAYTCPYCSENLRSHNTKYRTDTRGETFSAITGFIPYTTSVPVGIVAGLATWNFWVFAAVSSVGWILGWLIYRDLLKDPDASWVSKSATGEDSQFKLYIFGSFGTALVLGLILGNVLWAW
ncbi:hypothetical protein [Sphingorhabdus sp.]|uniref:hypothetical protein n=1 Tax=Sphingorhabdus sp. TaxID=1902408 RepID=UPI0035B3D771